MNQRQWRHEVALRANCIKPSPSACGCHLSQRERLAYILASADYPSLKLTFSAEDLGWRYLNPRGSYSAVCNRDFPIQADVTLKLGTVAKLSYAKQPRVMLVRTTLGWTYYSISMKVLEFLKPFSKGFKRSARQSLAAFARGPSMSII